MHAPSWRAPIQTQPRSHNACAQVLVGGGDVLLMSVETGRGGRVACIASLPCEMTQTECQREDFLALVTAREKLSRAEVLGSA